MKIRTFRYMFKEGLINTYKNKLMSLASITAVIASLVIFGLFFLLLENIRYNANILNEQQEMKVFCDYELEEEKIKEIEKALKQIENIKDYRLITAREAFEEYKIELGENADILEGFDENTLLSASFIVTLNNPDLSRETEKQIMAIEGVRKVAYYQEVIDFISRLSKWINAVSWVLIFILLLISVFIISNTIRLTVFARRREISIMKYIGATDWFIRWPFIFEGVIIGLIGAIIAAVLTNYGYGIIETKFNTELFEVGSNYFSLVSKNDISLRLSLFYCLTGCTVGAVGSLISIRKYLSV